MQPNVPAPDSFDPPIVTTVPPDEGPDHGATWMTMSDSSSNCMPLEVLSRPFVLTSKATKPGGAATDELHTSAEELTYTAATAVAFKRQRSAPAASALAANPAPTTVTGVPPSDAPRCGHTDDRRAAAKYVNAIPLVEYCWPFADTSTRRGPATDDGGV